MSDINKEDLERLEQKIDSIDKKLGSKWVLPVSLAILGAVLGLFTFLVEQNVNKSNVAQIEQNRIAGTLKGEEIKVFYNDVWDLLFAIDRQFESFVIGLEKDEEDKLDSLLIQFYEVIEKQRHVDQQIIKKCKNYSEYVSEGSFGLGNGEIAPNDAKKVYVESKTLFKIALDAVRDYSENLGS